MSVYVYEYYFLFFLFIVLILVTLNQKHTITLLTIEIAMLFDISIIQKKNRFALEQSNHGSILSDNPNSILYTF